MMSDIKSQLGQRVRELRKSKGLSQEQLAHLSGLSRQYIADVERGARNIAIVNVEKIAKALEIPLSKLFDFK
jgi:transcriptional regulator with XRE-family HTH domain